MPTTGDPFVDAVLAAVPPADVDVIVTTLTLPSVTSAVASGPATIGADIYNKRSIVTANENAGVFAAVPGGDNAALLLYRGSADNHGRQRRHRPDRAAEW